MDLLGHKVTPPLPFGETTKLSSTAAAPRYNPAGNTGGPSVSPWLVATPVGETPCLPVVLLTATDVERLCLCALFSAVGWT